MVTTTRNAHTYLRASGLLLMCALLMPGCNDDPVPLGALKPGDGQPVTWKRVQHRSPPCRNEATPKKPDKSADEADTLCAIKSIRQNSRVWSSASHKEATIQYFFDQTTRRYVGMERGEYPPGVCGLRAGVRLRRRHPARVGSQLRLTRRARTSTWVFVLSRFPEHATMALLVFGGIVVCNGDGIGMSALYRKPTGNVCRERGTAARIAFPGGSVHAHAMREG